MPLGQPLARALAEEFGLPLPIVRQLVRSVLQAVASDLERAAEAVGKADLDLALAARLMAQRLDYAGLRVTYARRPAPPPDPPPPGRRRRRSRSRRTGGPRPSATAG